MAKTNFSALTDEQKQAWSREIWKTARQNSFIMSLAGTSENSPIQRITELTQTERGDQCVLTLVPDLEEDGAMGDNELWDSEEAIKAFDQVIYIDQIRHANRTAGRMMEQRSIVKFRETSKNVLGFWLADRTDQMAFLTLSGIDPRLNTNGSLRTGFTYDWDDLANNSWFDQRALTRAGSGAGRLGYGLIDLAFYSDPNGALGDRVYAPSTNRHFRWSTADSALYAGDTTAIAASDLPSYKMLVELKAYAKDKRIRPIHGDGGQEMYHIVMHPKAMAKLKLDADFLANVRNAGPRGDKNPLFSGSIVTVDGLVLHENTHVYNTMGAYTGAYASSQSAAADAATDWAGAFGHRWGSDASVVGSRTLLLGAQALGYVDLASPMWEEDDWDYKNQLGISVSKICGFLKPRWYSPMDSASTSNADREDYGVIAVDHAM